VITTDTVRVLEAVNTCYGVKISSGQTNLTLLTPTLRIKPAFSREDFVICFPV